MDQKQREAIINEATALRGWISNSYAQVEFLLGDLIIRCRQFPEYEKQTETFTHSATKRVSKVRSMLEAEGPLSKYKDHLGIVLEGFEAHHEVRNLLAHGFCEFHFTATGDSGMYFRKFDRGDVKLGQEPDILSERTFRLIDLQYYKAQFVHQAEQALKMFNDVHTELGWKAPLPGVDA